MLNERWNGMGWDELCKDICMECIIFLFGLVRIIQIPTHLFANRELIEENFLDLSYLSSLPIYPF